VENWKKYLTPVVLEAVVAVLLAIVATLRPKKRRES
jgi:hypothetical protein